MWNEKYDLSKDSITSRVFYKNIHSFNLLFQWKTTKKPAQDKYASNNIFNVLNNCDSSEINLVNKKFSKINKVNDESIAYQRCRSFLILKKSVKLTSDKRKRK